MIVLDDNIEDHPKFAALSNDAFALWVRCLGYCRRSTTDGFVPSSVALSRARMSRPQRAIAELLMVAPGCHNPLWIKVDGGYQFHDYLEWNPSREQVEAKLEKLREKGRKGGLRSGQVRQDRAKDEPEAKLPASTNNEAPCFGSGSTQTNPGPVRSGPVRREEDVDVVPVPGPSQVGPAATTTTTTTTPMAQLVLEELKRHPKLRAVATHGTAADVVGIVMSAAIRLEDALEAIRAVAFDLEDGATEASTRKALRAYLGKAKVHGDRRRAELAKPPPERDDDEVPYDQRPGVKLRPPPPRAPSVFDDPNYPGVGDG